MKFSPQGFIDYEIPQQQYDGMPPQVVNNYSQQPQYEQEEEQPYIPQPIEPIQGAVYPNQDQGFLQWLFSFRKEAVTPLRNVWRGKEYDFDNHCWHESKSDLRVINEKGITWAISLIESYMNPAFIVTDLDDKTYNFRMREAAKIIWNSLCLRFKEFDMQKSDIPRVAEEIESKISAILRGALNDGYRDFFSTQNQTIEHKQLNAMGDLNTKPSMWTRGGNIFRHLGQSMGEGSQRQY